MTIWFTKTLVEHWVASLYMVSGHCKLIRKTKLYATDEKKAMVKIDDINSFFLYIKARALSLILFICLSGRQVIDVIFMIQRT